MPIFSRQKKSQKKKVAGKKSAAKATPTEVAEQGTAQKKDGAATDTPPPPLAPPPPRKESGIVHTTKHHDKEQTKLDRSLEYSPNDQIEDTDAPFDEALVDSAHVEKVAINIDDTDDDVANTAKRDTVVEAENNNNSTSLGQKFTDKASHKGTKITSKAPFFRKSKKRGSEIEKADKEIDKVDKTIVDASERKEKQQGKQSTNLTPITKADEKHGTTTTGRDGVARELPESNDGASSKNQKNDDMTTTDDETDTSTTIDEWTTSCGNHDPPSPLGGCAGVIPSKEDVAHKIDEAVLFLDKIVAPKLALAFLCLSPEEESVELGYQENTGRHHSSRRSRRNDHRGRSVGETPKKNNASAIKME